MYKLDNKGFGFVAFLSFLFILILAIIVVAILAYPTKLSPRNNNSINNNNINKYKAYEESAVEAAMIYVNDNYESIAYESDVIINIMSLALNNNVKSTCSGYVKVNMMQLIPYYHAYLSCPSYITEGYVSELDK